jgi:nitroimidazol reductase NimA-like FMN-containing flavoprotein (pyridoxamine 5'-phosphate oxidase superfamily)
MTALAEPVRRVLDEGTLCHVASLTPRGPHVTPMVFAAAGGSVWVTTSRGSVKARAWRSDPRVAGLVRAGDEAVAFVGTALAHDALDPSSWGDSILRFPTLSIAAARFTRKNARFFAGYAVDANHVPLAWTPPGRVFVELSVERVALLEAGREPDAWPGADRDGLPSAERFRAARVGADPLERLPADVAAALGPRGLGALALQGERGPAVLPVAWTVDGGGLYAIADERVLALASPSSEVASAALEMDRSTSWRARRMLGAMVCGRAELHAIARLSSGAASARRIVAAAGVDGDRLAIARVRADRFVWWRGWEAGTVAAA